MSVMMVRAKVQEEKVGEVEAAARKMFAAIEDEQPEGVRYASCKLPDGVTFVAILDVDEALADNPLASVQAFNEFQNELKNWLAGPPAVEPAQVVGSYRLFGA